MPYLVTGMLLIAAFGSLYWIRRRKPPRRPTREEIQERNEKGAWD